MSDQPACTRCTFAQEQVHLAFRSGPQPQNSINEFRSLLYKQMVELRGAYNCPSFYCHYMSDCSSNGRCRSRGKDSHQRHRLSWSNIAAHSAVLSPREACLLPRLPAIASSSTLTVALLTCPRYFCAHLNQSSVPSRKAAEHHHFGAGCKSGLLRLMALQQVDLKNVAWQQPTTHIGVCHSPTHGWMFFWLFYLQC